LPEITPRRNSNHIPDGTRHDPEELSASRLLLPSLGRSLSEDRQLHLAHGSLHAEHHSIIRLTRIVDTILVDDQTIDQATELKQRVPIASVARET